MAFEKSFITACMTSAVLILLGCGGSGSSEASGGSRGSTILATAKLGNLANANVTIYKVEDNGTLASLWSETTSSGKTLGEIGKFDSHVDDLNDTDIYLYEVEGGKDWDVNDTGVMDPNYTINKGIIRAISSGSEIKAAANNFIVSFATEILYEQVSKSIKYNYDKTNFQTLLQNNISKVVGDVNGDGKVDMQDILTFDPSQDKQELTDSYRSNLQAILDAIHNGKTPTPNASVWAKTYSWGNEAKAVQQTHDGGYIVAGTGDAYQYVLLLKLDETGNVTWQKGYAGNACTDRFGNEAVSIQQTSDGGYIVAGNDVCYGAGQDDIIVLKLGTDGSVQWQKTYGGIDNDVAYSISQTSDGGYIVSGYNFNLDDKGFRVLKLNSTGGIEWQKIYGATGALFTKKIDAPGYLTKTSDGGFIVAGQGSAGDVNDGTGGIKLLKLNSSGGIDWQKCYVVKNNKGGQDYIGDSVVQNGWPYFIQQTSDGGFIVSGVIHLQKNGDASHDYYAMWFLKVDSGGTIEWNKVYEGYADVSYIPYSIRQIDNGYIVAATSGSNANGAPQDALILKLDSSGNIVWQRTYAGPYDANYDDRVYSIQQTADGGYIVAGETVSYGKWAHRDMTLWVLKLDEKGDIHQGQGYCSVESSRGTTLSPVDANISTTDSAVEAIDSNITTQDVDEPGVISQDNSVDSHCNMEQ
ncbi:hypothetical protein [Hydrogenimonas sp. SS33]|uniref:hypothetical protein n=1 Tax=Hydrogenimonas leucolamina TaxID=2954236 RepID=UPI00336C2493